VLTVDGTVTDLVSRRNSPRLRVLSPVRGRLAGIAIVTTEPGAIEPRLNASVKSLLDDVVDAEHRLLA